MFGTCSRIDFNSDEPPTYRDLLYFSYNLRHDLPGLRHQRVGSEIRAVVPSLPAVLPVRHEHPRTTINLVVGIFSA